MHYEIQKLNCRGKSVVMLRQNKSRFLLVVVLSPAIEPTKQDWAFHSEKCAEEI